MIQNVSCSVPLSKESPPLTYHDTLPPVLYCEVPPPLGGILARVVLPQDDLLRYNLVALRILRIVEEASRV
jgi:hypothetical protein